MRTAQVAEKAGVNMQTLRYYERRGLLPEPPRTPSGYRSYGPETVLIVRFIKQVQELGFTLAQAEELLHLANGGPDPCEDVRRLANGKIAELNRKIDTLVTMRESLRRLSDTCDRPRADRECVLLQRLFAKAEQPL